MATKTKARKVQAKMAIVVNVGARPIVYEKRIVRDRHTGKLVEVDIHELPPATAKRSPGRPQTPLVELERAVAIYTEAFTAGLPPTKTVAERLNLSRSAAAKRIARSREKGLLLKTTPRTAGGVEGVDNAE